jgi:hypothetical protein
MSLTLDDRGLLTPGVHDASLKEIDKLFARFQKSDRRINLFRKPREYVAAVKKAKCGIAVIVNGSFVMGCIDEPDDIDLILILPPGWNMDEVLKPYQYNLVSKKRVRNEFGFDIFVVQPGSAAEQEWTGFLRKVNLKWCYKFGWPEDSTKGIVRVSL